MNSAMIIKAIIRAIKALYPTHTICLGQLLEDTNYPSWLINVGLQTTKVQNTDMLKKILTIDLIYFNSNKHNNVEDYMQSIIVKDNIQTKLFDSMYFNVEGSNVGLSYSTNFVDGLLNITLKLTYFNAIAKESISAELIEEILLNYK